MCLTGRYSQAAQCPPAAKQLFILTFAFKPTGVKIHQGAIADVTKWRATLSQPSSLLNNETACGQHKLYWLYHICHLDMITPLTKKKISSSRAFYQQWSQSQAIAGREHSLCFKDTVSILLDYIFFKILKKTAMCHFCSITYNIRALTTHKCKSLTQHQGAWAPRSLHPPSAKPLSRTCQGPRALYIQRNTSSVNSN